MARGENFRPRTAAICRRAFYGKADVGVAVSLGMTIAFIVVCVAVIMWISRLDIDCAHDARLGDVTAETRFSTHFIVSSRASICDCLKELIFLVFVDGVDEFGVFVA
jgi:hypothetical protein